nr:MAG TPA: hypothetical protein [Caudoviricetes sp.]
MYFKIFTQVIWRLFTKIMLYPLQNLYFTTVLKPAFSIRNLRL